jgi:formylglycine-generating enzyme required for sulfatase activity
LDEHPVTHVAFADAVNYCLWSGRRLPSEAEWEFAARGGLEGARYPWGDELEPRGERRANIWVGDFPRRGLEAAGSAGTSPVGSYPPNGYGLFDMAGNVWEWTRDWFAPSTYARRAHTAGPASVDPGGSDNGHDRSIRGGSHLCHDSYCNRYRVSARSRCEPSATAGNLGFRTVA